MCALLAHHVRPRLVARSRRADTSGADRGGGSTSLRDQPFQTCIVAARHLGIAFSTRLPALFHLHVRFATLLSQGKKISLPTESHAFDFSNRFNNHHRPLFLLDASLFNVIDHEARRRV